MCKDVKRCAKDCKSIEKDLKYSEINRHDGNVQASNPSSPVQSKQNQACCRATFRLSPKARCTAGLLRPQQRMGLGRNNKKHWGVCCRKRWTTIAQPYDSSKWAMQNIEKYWKIMSMMHQQVHGKSLIFNAIQPGLPTRKQRLLNHMKILDQ